MTSSCHRSQNTVDAVQLPANERDRFGKFRPIGRARNRKRPSHSRFFEAFILQPMASAARLIPDVCDVGSRVFRFCGLVLRGAPEGEYESRSEQSR